MLQVYIEPEKWNKWASQTQIKGTNHKETILLIHSKCCFLHGTFVPHRTDLAFLFPVILLRLLPWSVEEHESGWVGTWHQPRSVHHRGSAACWLKRCSFQTQTWLGFRLALSNVWYPAYSDSLTWLNFQWGICIGSCAIHNLLKLEMLEHKWLTWSPL